jgi:Ser/Thr protein kinase RdoA (MazF antagonist)
MDGESLVLRLSSDHRPVERITTEVDLLTDLTQVTDCVIAPRPFPSGRLVEAVRFEDRSYNAVLFPRVDGAHAEFSSFNTAFRLGELLAELHTALGALDRKYDLPVMKNVASANHLIHGDFGAANVLQARHSFVIIDFEDACYSSHAYELANSLYMMLFDSRHAVADLIAARPAQGFLQGYTKHITVVLDEVRPAIDQRVRLLAGWLTDPSAAPFSISTSSDDWRKELTKFVNAYTTGGFEEFLRGLAEGWD